MLFNIFATFTRTLYFRYVFAGWYLVRPNTSVGFNPSWVYICKTFIETLFSLVAERTPCSRLSIFLKLVTVPWLAPGKLFFSEALLNYIFDAFNKNICWCWSIVYKFWNIWQFSVYGGTVKCMFYVEFAWSSPHRFMKKLGWVIYFSLSHFITITPLSVRSASGMACNSPKRNVDQACL